MTQILSYHPSVWLIISSILMMASVGRYKLIFNLSSIFCPVVAIFMLSLVQDSGEVDFLGFKLIILHIHTYSKFFAYAFLLSLLIGTLYSISVSHHNEIILGHLLCAVSLAAVFAGDFIILFFMIEALMLLSFVLIFIGNGHYAKQAAIRYFMMHFISGALLLSGIIVLTTHSDKREIVALSEFLYSSDSCSIASVLILLSCLINAAVVPFSAWMTDAYPEASTSGTIFLIPYTSKVALFCLMILFPKFSLLYYFGIFTIIYGGVYALIETNLRKIACFSSVIHIGFALVCISFGTELLMVSLAALMFFNIVYKALILSCTAFMAEFAGVKTISSLLRTPKEFWFITFGLIFALSFMLSSPFSGSFIAKEIIVEHIGENIAYVLYLIVFATSFVAFPVLRLFLSKAKMQIKKPPNIFAKFTIIFGVLALVIPSFYISGILSKDFGIQMDIGIDLISNQLLFLVATVIIAFLFKDARRISPGILLSFDFVYRKLIFYCNFNFIAYYDKLISNRGYFINISNLTKTYSSFSLTVSNAILILFITIFIVFLRHFFAN